MFSNFVNHEFPDLIKEKMPLCRKNFGGSIYIEKVE